MRRLKTDLNWNELFMKNLYLWRDDERCPGDQDEEAGGEIVDNQILGVVTADLHVEPSQGEITQFSIVVQEQAIRQTVRGETILYLVTLSSFYGLIYLQTIVPRVVKTYLDFASIIFWYLLYLKSSFLIKWSDPLRL